MRIHILGICGTFMGGLAMLARSLGHEVTGSDANVYPPMSTLLENQGIDLIQGYDPSQLEPRPDLVIIGNAMTRGNPCVEAVLENNIPYMSGPQWLHDFVLRDRWVLAVAGTHGKTTTASMLAWVLEYAGLAPGFLIGGIPQNFGISARLPQAPKADPASRSPFFVIEADEYDTAFFDKRSKFVHYRPRTAILNNLEYDHADIFSNLAAIQTQFHHLVRTIPGQGLIVCNGREESLQTVLAQGCWTPVENFGSTEGWQAGEPDENGAFDVLHHGQTVGHIAWPLLGEHNRLNALAVIAAARHAGVSIQVACEALSQFQNVKRRMEVKGCVRGITVYDDFAHHPTAIATTIAGLRQKVGSARIIAVLEPRSNTMKLGSMKAALPESLAEADQVFCYGGGVEWDVAAALAPLGIKLHTGNDFDAFVQSILSNAKSGDHILVMSNGGFGGIHQKLLDGLAE